MRNRSIVLLVVLTLPLVILSCVTSSKAPFDKPTWRAKMHAISNSVSTLLPYAFSPRKFYNPQNRSIIEKELKSLAANASALDKEKVAPNSDPGLKFSSKKFSQDMRSTYRQFKLGNQRHARFMIQNVSNHCIGCHTKFQQGRSDLIMWKPNLKGLPFSEKAKFYIATRQYGLSSNILEKRLKNSRRFKNTMNDWEYVIEKSLAHAIRVDRSPQKTEKIIRLILANQQIPKYYRSRAKRWLGSTIAWQREMRKTNKKVDPYNKAYSLLKRAQKRSSFDKKSGLIDALRASAQVTSILVRGDSHKDYGNALYLAGQIAENLTEIDVWTLHESYYEKCIRKYPHTYLAVSCYERFELVLGEDIYGDDYASYLPEHVQLQLEELEELARINVDSGVQKYLDERLLWHDDYDRLGR